jgi:subtilisin family serine protease
MKTPKKSPGGSSKQKPSKSGSGSRLDSISPKYPDPVVFYPKILKKDLRLAEAFRVGDPSIPLSEKKLNPFQVKVGRKGRIWVDVLLERKKGVKIHDLERIMHVYGKPGRGRFISGRVRAERLPILDELTVRMQTARPVEPALNYSVKAIAADRKTINKVPSLNGLDGTGVIIGIVDEGCDFNHPNFKVNNKTRLVYLWDQNGSGGAHPKNYEYGIEYTKSDINAALKKHDPYAGLNNYMPDENSHGTHVIDIAAGNSPDTDYLGVAPGADLIFVDIRRPAKQKNITAEELIMGQLNTLGSSHDLVDAVKYIFEKADKEGKPAVVNLSLAASGGAHNGTSLVESMFDDLLSKLPLEHGRAIVIAAGNDFQRKLHTTGEVSSATPKTIKWNIPKAAKETNLDLRQEMEIWYPKETALKIEVLDPNENPVNDLMCRFGQFRTSDENTIIPIWTIQNAEADPAIDQENNHIEILVDNRHVDFQGGEWGFRLSHDELQPASNNVVIFHAWIENTYQKNRNNDGGDAVNQNTSSEFMQENVEPSSTINGIGNARLPIVVGACEYDANDKSYSVSYYTSAGPSLNPQCPQKPELYAPGDGISSAKAVRGERYDVTGTSMAAPHVTGVIALMFQRALTLPQPKILTMEQICNILIDSASDKRAYDPQLGFGRVNGCDALKKIS